MDETLGICCQLNMFYYQHPFSSTKRLSLLLALAKCAIMTSCWESLLYEYLVEGPQIKLFLLYLWSTATFLVCFT